MAASSRLDEQLQGKGFIFGHTFAVQVQLPESKLSVGTAPFRKGPEPFERFGMFSPGGLEKPPHALFFVFGNAPPFHEHPGQFVLCGHIPSLRLLHELFHDRAKRAVEFFFHHASKRMTVTLRNRNRNVAAASEPGDISTPHCPLCDASPNQASSRNGRSLRGFSR